MRLAVMLRTQSHYIAGRISPILAERDHMMRFEIDAASSGFKSFRSAVLAAARSTLQHQIPDDVTARIDHALANDSLRIADDFRAELIDVFRSLGATYEQALPT